jgi:hypothetical protein
MRKIVNIQQDQVILAQVKTRIAQFKNKISDLTIKIQSLFKKRQKFQEKKEFKHEKKIKDDIIATNKNLESYKQRLATLEKTISTMQRD